MCALLVPAAADCKEAFTCMNVFGESLVRHIDFRDNNLITFMDRIVDELCE